MFVLIDLGNSFLKLALVSKQKQIIDIKKIKLEFTQQKIIKEEITNFIKKQAINSNIKICSVNNNWTEFLNDVLSSYQLTWLSVNDFKNLKFNNKNEIGIDLLCLGAAIYNCSNTLIVSFGTATTFTLWNNNELIGAIISPGPWASFKGLLKSAALIDDEIKIPLNSDLPTLSNDTHTAIAIGTFKGHALMAESLINDIKNNYQVDQVIITGGGINNINLYLEKKYKINKNLIFEGILKL